MIETAGCIGNDQFGKIGPFAVVGSLAVDELMEHWRQAGLRMRDGHTRPQTSHDFAPVVSRVAVLCTRIARVNSFH
jgi:hypothetical protein